MVLQAVQGIVFPNLSAENASSIGDLTMDADGEKVGFLFRVPKTGTLDHVIFRAGTVTTGDTLKVSFQDVNTANGEPDETVDEYRTVSVSTGDTNTWVTTGIISTDGTDGGTKRSVTQGDWLFVVFEFNSYVAGALGIRTVTSSRANAFPYQSYATLKAGGTWVIDDGRVPLLGLVYDDGSYGYMPDASVWYPGSVTYGNGSTPDENALAFSLPFPCKVHGAFFLGDLDGDADLVLYDSDGSTPLASASMDTDVRSSTGGGISFVVFGSDVTLAKDTTYRISVKPTTATSVLLRLMDLPNAAARAQGVFGTGCSLSSRTDAGSWSEDTTVLPKIGLFISALDDGVGGGGGGLIPRGIMTGGRL